MKRLYSALFFSAVVLSACNSPTTVSYHLNFLNTTGSGDTVSYGQAVLRVVTRRLQNLGEQPLDNHIKNDATGITLALTLNNQDAAKELTRQLTEPFTVSIMEELPQGSTEKPDAVIQGQGSFKKTQVNERMIVGVDSRKNPTDGKGEVRLRFTDKGITMMKSLFATHQGKSLGLFVRGKLVSKLMITSAVFPNDLTIRGIPDANLAAVFADDMNVGLHVTFTPLP